WSDSQAREFKNRHPWLEWRERKLGCTVCRTIKSTGVLTEKRVSISEEWISFKIQSSGSIENREAALSSLRNKIRRHEMSRAHEIAQERKQKCGQDLLGHMARSLSDTVLHSRYSSTKIVEHIAKEMQTRILNSIVSSSSKLSVLIDEATSASHKTAMIVSVKASIDGATPEFLFLDVEKALLNCLETAGFSDEWLKKNWIAFVSDGASVMLGRNSGVATRLTAKYLNIFTWHCMNHRLELAVGDAIDEVATVNHFKTFMEKIHNLYSQSSKNSRELLEAAQEVGSHVQQIGRVLNTRWVASSFRAVKAVWRSYGALNKHFENRQTYRGLARRLQSKEFLSDLGLMYDALSELSNLSQQLQAQSVTLLKAEQLLKRTIRVLRSFKDSPGEKSVEAIEAQAAGHFGTVPLESNPKLISINPNQFLQSLINNIEKRFSFEGEMLHDLRILDTSNWPSKPTIRYGETEVKRLYLVEDQSREPENLKPLITCMQTIPCSTAECERGFSLMNNICTDKRSSLMLSNISHLMMISINGPPVNLLEPRKYVTTWLRNHRSATETRRQVKHKEPQNKHVWNIFNLHSTSVLTCST
uniref:HAT C-terminal dimerisation domain-containing protein n=1 Tax=Fundulus heteroclitus TaxID=8078 RepID=A0A3Q2PD66_FUNHE